MNAVSHVFRAASATAVRALPQLGQDRARRSLSSVFVYLPADPQHRRSSRRPTPTSARCCSRSRSYALVALGLNIVVGYAGLLDLGYVGFFAIGAYTVGVLGSAHAKLPLLLCIPIARGRHADLAASSSAPRRCASAATTSPS